MASYKQVYKDMEEGKAMEEHLFYSRYCQSPPFHHAH